MQKITWPFRNFQPIEVGALSARESLIRNAIAPLISARMERLTWEKSK